jgi:Xaa-Pro aminopeptidase
MFNDRIERLRAFFEKNKIEAFFISNFYNILYFTGFKTLTTNEREAFVLVTKKNTYLFTDGRYIDKKFALPILNIRLALIEPGKGLFYHLRNIIEREKIKSFGIEADDIRQSEYQKFTQIFNSVSIVPTERVGLKLREVKDEKEIEKIKKACEITDQCLEEIIPSIKIKMTEQQLAFNIEMWIKKKGYDLAFDPIVAVNKNSALPHYHTKEGAGKIEKESIILIDFGVKAENYLSDITRMVFLNPTVETLNIYDWLLQAQKKTTKYIRPEVKPGEIDAYCRTSLADSHLPNFPHSLGHGVGLEIHEFPKISHLSDDSITDGQIFTIEPGVYFEGRWGMRIEDTVVIKNWDAEPLTEYTKEPYIIKS